MSELSAIGERLRAAGAGLDERTVAEALGWTGDGGRVEVTEHRIDGLRATRAFFRGEPAVFFVAPERTPDRSDDDLIQHAALAAYHASIDWGALTAPEGLTIFHSRWIRNRAWYRLPRLSWSRLMQEEQLRHALSPEGVTSGTLQRVATQSFYPADDYLRPVDEELVGRLDSWRRRALAIAPAASGVDEALQVLFAQFFVLRAVEDRHLVPGLPPLRDVLRGGEVDRGVLERIFAEARARIQSELFAELPGRLIDEEVVTGVIWDLYVPHHLPVRARYNFAWLDADVLGRAYEKYIARVLEPLPPPPQQELFGAIRHVGERDVRRQEGVYYTPSYLVRSLVAMALDPVIAGIITDGVAGPVTPPAVLEPLSAAALPRAEALASAAAGGGRLPFIADFACGSGGFLVAAADYLLRRLRERDPTRPWAHDLVKGCHLVGIDKDARAVTLTRLNLYIRLTAEPESLPLPSLDRCVVNANSLTAEPWEYLPREYDAVLGNPPFAATENQPTRQDLTGRFETAQGRFDIAYLFVELAIRKLRRHGVLSLVVPNRLFRNRDAGPIRSLLTAEADLLCLIDFESHEVFKGVSAYIGTVTARRREPTDPDAKMVRVVRVLTIEEIEFLGPLLTRAADTTGAMRNDALEAFDVPHPRGGGPWLLLAPEARARRLALGARSVRLGEIAPSRQGIRTGANDVFILTVESEAGGYARVANAAGDSATIETGLLRPVVFGTEIQRYDAVAPSKYVLYPYRRGVVVEETELRERYPKTWEYLERYRAALAERGSLARTGGRWYELIWRRTEAWLDRPKLLIRDLILETAFAIDEPGGTYLVGGTAVVPAELSHLWPLLGYLNSELVADYLRQTTPVFRGGFVKIEPRHLDELPVPRKLLNDPALSALLGAAARSAVEAKATGRSDDLFAAEQEIERLVVSLLEGPPEEDDGDDVGGEGADGMLPLRPPGRPGATP